MTTKSINTIFQVEYFTALLGSIDDSVVATDENFIIQYWNKKAEKLFGCTQQEAVGKRGEEILHFTFRNDNRETAKRTLLDKGIWRGNVNYLTKEGKQLLLDASVTVVKNESGKIIGYVGVHRDITEYDWAKTSLFTFLSFIAASGDYFFVVDKELNIAFIDDYTNQQLKDIYGFSYAIGEPVTAPLPEERKKQIIDCYQKALRGEQNGYEIKVHTVKGKELWLRVSYFPVKDYSGYITHACSLVKDITAEIQVQEVHQMLYQSRRLFETFMENSPILSWISDKNGTIKYLSPSYLKTHQLSKDVIGTSFTKVFPTAVSTSFLANNNNVYQTKQPLSIIERTLTPDGVERTYHVIKFPIQTDDDLYIGGWAVDVTDEIALRKDLSESLDKLKASEKILKEALEKEHHLNEMKSRFVSMASHEFRTPLSTVLSSIYLLERYTTTEQQANRLKHAGKIKEAVEHMNDLLEDFLTLGKLEEGKIVFNPVLLDLHELLGDIVEELEAVKKTGQVIHYRFLGEHRVITDKKIVRNVLLNVLGNAIKFSKENKEIWLHADHQNGCVHITVKDEGIGISKANQAHLFQSFYRATNAQNIQGTGLGLNIVKQYVNLLGGSVSLQSELNKGTTIAISFPTAAPLQE
jgi:PAS domain S-box-containing protein